MVSTLYPASHNNTIFIPIQYLLMKPWEKLELEHLLRSSRWSSQNIKHGTRARLPQWHLTPNYFFFFFFHSVKVFLSPFYGQKEVAQVKKDMGYQHLYRIIFDYKVMIIKLIISWLPQLWPVPTSGRRSSGRQSTVREVQDKWFLLISAWSLMEKWRKPILLLLQIHPKQCVSSTFNIDFILLTVFSIA